MELKKNPNFLKIFFTSGLFISLLFSAGCASKYQGKFISDQKLENNLEYSADVIVNKEGYSFLWLIPFSSASEDAAKRYMESEVKKKYPDAAGVFEYEMIQKNGVSLFDWKPTVTIRGKVARIPNR